MSVDPRVGLELEKLNNSCEKINNLEVNLDELKRTYSELQKTSQAEIKLISNKIKNAIDLAKPFYESRRQTSELLKELKTDQANHERAKTNLAAAKEMVYLAEQSVTQNAQEACGLDIALQEMISHATSRVNQYTDECNRMQNRLRVTELKCEMTNLQSSKLQTQLKSFIKASRPYYETRANYNAKLRNLKTKIVETEREVQQAKAAYNEALQNLEKISDEIHKLREDQKLNEYNEENDTPKKNKTYLCYQNSLSDDYELVDDDDEPTRDEDQQKKVKIVEWSDIPLNSMTDSESSTSSYSQHSDQNDGEASGSKVPKEDEDEKKQSGSGFSDWISKSSFRRQSLEDVFAQSTIFGKFGRSLERRNSESEVETSTSSNKKEFFLFGRHEGLTDSQIENLFLPPEHL
ncbi:CLUMA_CG013989, isoform A [Clunio marinus]|uniref:CLUMA_CG013989, isoform A n=1 Tax=Clunio marinus TaxID=568069 RepID=A0A1J1IKF8_9DIPT|nr:CLUMA_CG013989, isoform A [Clunio marinus]